METWKKVALGVGAAGLVTGILLYAREARAVELGTLLRTSGYYEVPVSSALSYARAIDVVTLESGKPTALDWCLAEQKAGRAVLVPRSMYEGRLPKPGYPSSIMSVPQEKVEASTKSGLYVALPPATPAAPKTGDDGSSTEMTEEEAKLQTPAWSDVDFIQLINVSRDIRCKPEDLLLVLCSESNLRPDARNPADKSKYPFAAGLNQMTFLAAVMIGSLAENEKEQWPAMAQRILDTPVGAQLEIVRRYFNATPWGRDGHEWPSAAKLYQANAAPSTLYSGVDLSSVIYGKDTDAYDLNKGLDANGDGQVTLGDLAAAVNYYKGTPLYKAAMMRLEAARTSAAAAVSGAALIVGAPWSEAQTVERRLGQMYARMPWFKGASARPSAHSGAHVVARVARGYERFVPAYYGGVRVTSVAF